MKVLIVTVAGCSTRFSRSVGEETIKCLYFQNSFEESLLYRIFHQPFEFDRYIIVGGYRYEELKTTVESRFPEYKKRMVFVENPYFKEYGSGYSLFYGIKEAQKLCADEVVFAEGDLFLDSETFVDICTSKKSVVSLNRDPILANKAVAFYFNKNNTIRYIYDTGHDTLFINEPFISIYNSGQVWKFTDKKVVDRICTGMTNFDWQGTNLVFVERYFNTLAQDDFRLVCFKEWINCNTVDDFINSLRKGKQIENN